MFKERYFPSIRLNDWLNAHAIETEIIGNSELGKPIHAIRLGEGPVKILMWSQMHGNESTTTRGLLIWLEEYLQSPSYLKELSLLIIPQLNPDGADKYTRVNGKGIDLNRDALTQSQSEIKALMRLVEEFQPHYNLNLHDQRTRFTVGDTNKEAALSFLSAAADDSRKITPTRIVAMHLINHMVSSLPDDFKKHIGRYDDGFNPNCTGDYFHSKGIPTVLFEAGQLGKDYTRTNVTSIIAQCLSNLLEFLSKSIPVQPDEVILKEYCKIPENKTNSYDELVITEKYQFYVRYIEVLVNDQIDKLFEFTSYDKVDATLLNLRQILDYRKGTLEEQQLIRLRLNQYLKNE
jgi:hypothetical protein